MKKLIYSLIAILILILATIVFTGEKKSIEPNEWKIIRNYVTSNYPISENYFDTHFKFISITPDRSIRSDDFDYDKKEFSTILTDITMISYTLMLNDSEGTLQSFSNSANIYLHNSKVIDSEQTPDGLSDEEISRFKSYSYDHTGTTHEIQTLISRNEAANIAKSNSDCTNTKFLDITEAEKNLELLFIFGKASWSWQSRNSGCTINAETGEIYQIDLNLNPGEAPRLKLL